MFLFQIFRSKKFRDEVFLVEYLQVGNPFPYADELDRYVELVGNPYHYATLGCTVELGHHKRGDVRCA